MEPIQVVYDIARTRGIEYPSYLYYQQLVNNNYKYIMECDWGTDVLDIDAHELKNVFSAEFSGADGTKVTFGEIGQGAVLITLHNGRIMIRVASEDKFVAQSFIESTKGYYTNEADDRDNKKTVPIKFWYIAANNGSNYNNRKLVVPDWEDIKDNYSTKMKDGLNSLMAAHPTSGGRLLIWHGPPGSGKTFAIRALAWEWRKWASFHYVVEPDKFLGSNSGGLLDIALDEDYDLPPIGGSGWREMDNDKWKVLILEDSNELLTVDASENVGQALSRLLNLIDGLLGQGLRIIVLITTNHEIGKINPALLRPGRCWQNLSFESFDAVEANRWLEQHGIAGDIVNNISLAELYAKLRGEEFSHSETKIGFAV